MPACTTGRHDELLKWEGATILKQTIDWDQSLENAQNNKLVLTVLYLTRKSPEDEMVLVGK